MVCFEIILAYPPHERANVNKSNESRLQHMLKHYAGDQVNKVQKKEYILYTIAICDTAAANFLRDLPEPFFVVFIYLRYKKELLYMNPKVGIPYHKIHLPKIEILRDVYWNAKRCEKNQPPNLVLLE
jgi:hypothetical protein